MENTDYNFDSTSLLVYLYKKRKPLFIITFLAVIVSVIVSYTIEPRYKSTVVLFPASSGSISQSLLTANVAKKDILKFGEEEEVEQLMQALYSDEIRDRIIEKYKLMAHYDIDTASRYPYTNLAEKFQNNISFIRTEYMSIEIQVLDTDPQVAADIANDIAALVDTTMNHMKKDRALKALKLVEKEYIALKDHVSQLNDSLRSISEKGVNDYESQSEVFNAAYAKAIIEGKYEGAKLLEEKLAVLAKYGGTYLLITNLLEFEADKLSELEAKYAEAKLDYEQDLPHKFIVNSAVKAEKKSYPIRWLIVAVSTLATFVLALLALILGDKINTISANLSKE